MAVPTTTLWPLEPHTRGKHLVLKNYLDAWYPILGTSTERLLFIDGFAGPGEYEGGEMGSPLIALRSFMDHTAGKRIPAQVVFIFVESDEARKDHLDSLVSPLKPSLPATATVKVIHGKFDRQLTWVLDRLDEQAKRLAPAFVMIDPFGVSDTPMDVVGRILRNSQCEVYASFMYDAINRFKDTEEFEPHLDSLFGCDRWRLGLGITDPVARKEFYFGLYRDQLRSCGAEQVVYFELYEGNRLIYAIFHASKYWLAADKMKMAIWRVSPFGDFAFRGTHAQQLALNLDLSDFRPLISCLKSEFSRQGWVRVEEVQEFVGSDRTDYHTGHLKKRALKPLEEAKEIEVDENSRRRARTYPPGTRIKFL